MNSSKINDTIYIIGSVLSVVISFILFSDIMEAILFSVIGIFCFTGYWFSDIVGRYENWIKGENRN